ncbi:MAG: hypothetical protein JWN44_4606 [Myxococcales bacterium]|nr:hypothetical protein [Myxococcales bacterium]
MAALGAAACTIEFVKNAHCDVDADCGDPNFPSCNTASHACRVLGSGGDMNPGDLPPIACSMSSMCPRTSEPICDLTINVCRGCSNPDAGISSECTARDANRPLCAGSGACVQCVANRDCIKDAKTCDTAAGSCVPCTKNSDCASGICGAGGVCADPAMIVYVNKSGVSCPGGTGQGSLDDPYCTIQAGFNQGALQGKRVVVFSGVYPENVSIQTSTTSYTVNAIGVGQPTLSPSATGAGLKLANGGMMINVTLDGFVIQSAIGGSGVDCTGVAPNANTRLSLLRSTLRNNAQYGIIASKCLVTIDQTTIAQNASGGVYASDADVTIQNTLVRQNGMAASGATYGGIFLTAPMSAGSATVVNTTVVNNKTSGGALATSGISCGFSANILNSVVHSNTGSSMEMNATSCPPDHSAFVGAAVGGTGTNNIELATCTSGVVFVDANNNNYTPRSGAGACSLIDKGIGSHVFNTTTVTAPSYDLNGAPRSSGTIDIGALEAM